MATNLQIISDALREINVISEIDTPSAEQGQHALRALNRMMERWTEGNIEIGYFKQSATTGTIPVPEWAEDGIVAKLAVRLAPIYGASVSPELALAAREGYRAILRKCQNEKSPRQDMTNMPQGEARYRAGRNILTDN